ncbi:CGNR zinc finger domain-containing protein [Blastococcus sp. MG754426]|uniref:CGNR zinc finger domain-containing protein n=1 Tax=unclassified Blastococcus TaxID=2619396 RepID=UPI001EF0CD08|nr:MULTISPECIES: CGNR zinc finger domain-containing protein [unclassified Blastococcus]MCF6509426.1 CGNR zinc finger domain-containing protein [Blastococcus sp. MG754426]MCF6513943.1 CGNR zinc finger domain-containing protein [Blastococcus sp. MG754427]MCF6735139.1 CGNR zinc finger domain-containing protein [Blastococcus sp. KM273129]
MDYDTYGSTAVELAIDLANADLAPDDGVARFLASHEEWFTTGTSAELTPSDVEKAGATARLVRAVALAESQDDVLIRLNELLALARPRPYATDHDGELHLHYARPDAPVLEQLTTTVAMGLSQVVVQHGWQRLGVCSAEGCDDVYVDTSRNASRRYCSNTCASRSTVAAYRARQKS